MKGEDDAPELPAVPLDGLSPAAIRAFCAAHAGTTLEPTAAEVAAAEAEGTAAPTALPFESLTTAQVVQRVIKPATLSTQGSYAELLRQRAAPGETPVARATVFLSHAWSYPFCDLTAAVFARFSGGEAEEGVYVWNDIFVGSQHKSPDLPQEWWAQTFRQAVAAIGHTLLVLQPWSEPAPLKRSWCLWEVFASIDSGARLEVVLPPKEERAFQQAILAQPEDIMKAVSKIDTRNAQAYFEADRAKIAEAVRTSEGGFEAVNGRIHDRLRLWLEEQTRQLVTQLATQHGELHAETLTARARLAWLLVTVGKRDEALELCFEVLRCRREVLGPEHEDTVSSASVLSFQLYLAGRFADGAKVAEEALTGCGEDHAFAPKLQNSVALCCMRLDRLPEAESLLLRVLQAWRAQHGELHVSTMAALNNLGLVYTAAGRLEEAQATYDELVRCRCASDGENHPNTLSARQNLGELLSKRQLHDKAIALLSDVLRRRRELQGEQNLDTWSALCTLGDAQREAGFAADVVAALSTALENVKSQHGNVSTIARLVMRCLARAHLAVGDPAAAEPLFEEILKQRVKLFGVHAPFVVESRADLVACLRQQGREADAAARFDEAE